MIPARLLTLVRSEVAGMYQRCDAGRGERWSSWVSGWQEWDRDSLGFRRFVARKVGANYNKHRRLVDACTAEWFRYARSKEQVS